MYRYSLMGGVGGMRSWMDWQRLPEAPLHADIRSQLSVVKHILNVMQNALTLFMYVPLGYYGPIKT